MPLYNPGSGCSKIDEQSTNGLLGVHDSLAYRVEEIERHLHSYEGWAGVAAVPNGEIHAMDAVAPGIVAFQLDAGNNDWGAWRIIVGSSDTPFINAADEYYDMHRVMFTQSERTALYWVQFAFGTDTADAAYTARQYTTIPFLPASPNTDGPMEVQLKRQLSGTKMWARCFCPGQNTGTLSFFPGGHEYEG